MTPPRHLNGPALAGALSGHTVVITGGGGGLGRACGEEILNAGASVVLCGRDAARLEAAGAALEAGAPGRVDVAPGDVTIPADVERMFATASRRGKPLGVVHAAAVLSAIGPVTTVDPAAWDATVRTNLFGTFLVIRTACRLMEAAAQGGSIVLFSGGGASGPFPNYTAYACSKVAVVRLAETVAQEVAHAGIRINCIAPGFVATGIHEATLRAGSSAGEAYLRRTEAELAEGGVSPSLAARAVAFLLSGEAAGISGRLVSAVHDDWAGWPGRAAEIAASDLFTLRRIVPSDRGHAWR